MEKLVIFDLDGVLIDSKEIHFIALNQALGKINKKYIISLEDHNSVFDGLPTSEKLNKLSLTKGLPKKYYKEIWNHKQKETLKVLEKNVKKDLQLIKYFRNLKKNKIKIVVASNSIKKTIKLVLNKLELTNYVDLMLGNEDVKMPKPFPEIYWLAMIKFSINPKDTVIIEDSHIGRNAALNSGANLVAIDSRKDLDDLLFNKILNILKVKSKSYPWISQKLNVLIPMAGLGSRFASQGYTFPKPLVEVKGKPMIQVVVENLNIDANFIFIVQKEHLDKYNLKYLLSLIAPNCKIITVNGTTEGAACTSLLAKKLINNKNPLLMANSDQFIEWDSNETLYAFSNDKIDGGILTFPSKHPKWSFAKLSQNGFVSEVAEKKPISEHATVGIYYWKQGSDYVKYAEQMIKKNIRVNNEFYVCPVFNEAIKDKKKIRIKEIKSDQMWGIGTPEDLNYFIENYKEKI